MLSRLGGNERQVVFALASTLALACGGEPSADGSGGQSAAGGTSSGGTTSSSGGTPSGSGGAASGGAASSTGGSDPSGSGGSVTSCTPAKVLAEDLPGSAEFYEEIEGPWTTVKGLHGDGDDVYVLQNGSLYVIHGADTTPVLVSDEIGDLGIYAGGGRLKTSDTHVYFATAHGVARVPKEGGAAEVVYDDPNGEMQTEYIEVAGDKVFFSAVSGAGVWSVAAAGGEPTRVSETIEPVGFARLEDKLYVADFAGGLIQTMPAAGGDWTPASPADPFAFLEGVAVSADQVFWVDDDILKAAPIGLADQATDLGAAVDGNIEVSGDRVYWQDTSVGWIQTDGTACGGVVQGYVFSDVWEYGVTPAYVYVYFTGLDPVLLRIPVE